MIKLEIKRLNSSIDSNYWNQNTGDLKIINE
jgi:hypothetical protein